MDLPGWVSLLPPLVAIGTALAFRQVLPALFLGIWVGAWALSDSALAGIWEGLLDVPNVFVLRALAPEDGDTSHASIIVFTMLIGGLVGIISRSCGTLGIVRAVTRWATNRRRGQITTGALGLVIFFDDYANTLVVGHAMRPVTDRLRISREKLAYIVDSTAAPVASLALVSTWIGFEVGLISDALAQIDLDASGYGAFVSSLAYRFYPVLALLLVLAVAITGRDLRSMRLAEERAIQGQPVRPGTLGGELDADMAPKEDVPQRLANVVIPLLVLVVTTLAFLFVTGEGNTIRAVIGSADSYSSLVYGALLGVAVAAAMALAQRILTVEETLTAWLAGVKSVLFVLIILVMAWALAAVTEQLGTAEYLADLMGDQLPLWSVPVLLFLVAAGTAFATGTSWGTMGILMPLVVPLTWAIAQTDGVPAEEARTAVIVAISTVLAGAVWGDHCSPISDTTVLSALASGCDPVDHVRTQIPYAVLAGAVSLGALLLVGSGLPAWLVWAPAVVVTVGALVLLGRVPQEAEAAPEETAVDLER